MSVRLIQDRLDGYGCRTALEEEQALREITQEIVLAAIGRTDFFQKASFQGGTCLRIFHGLNRFSEDLDFALLAPDSTFVLRPYLEVIAKELTAYGYGLEIDDRTRANRTVRVAFTRTCNRTTETAPLHRDFSGLSQILLHAPKDDSLGHLLRLAYRPATGPMRKLRIKLEVDTNPPAGGSFEIQTMDFPFPSAIRVFDDPSLFAGKLHAILCREYLKGRDWYDFVWYTARGTRVNYALLASALSQQGPWQGKQPHVDRDWCLAQLRDRIEATDWKRAREDVRRFVKPEELPSLELWSLKFFLAQCNKLGG